MPTLQGYEVIDQTAFRIADVRNPFSVLKADYGDGYGDAVLVGAQYGTKSFTATAGVWPDNVSYGTIDSAAWMEYYWTFLQTRLNNGNEPFVISWRSAYWLVVMDDPETAVECVRCDNFDLFVPAKIKLKNRRVIGVTTNADGSMTGSVVP
jgi:hypothetical protein